MEIFSPSPQHCKVPCKFNLLSLMALNKALNGKSIHSSPFVTVLGFPGAFVEYLTFRWHTLSEDLTLH